MLLGLFVSLVPRRIATILSQHVETYKSLSGSALRRLGVVGRQEI